MFLVIFTWVLLAIAADSSKNVDTTTVAVGVNVGTIDGETDGAVDGKAVGENVLVGTGDVGSNDGSAMNVGSEVGWYTSMQISTDAPAPPDAPSVPSPSTAQLISVG